MAGRVVEGGAVAGVQIAFRRHAVGQQDVVAVELDVPIGDAVLLDLHHRLAVNEAAHGDQHLVFIQGLEAERVTGREPQVGVGQSGAERAGGDVHRPHFAGLRMTGTVGVAMAEPADRSMGARRGDDEIADNEALHGDVAARGSDQRAGNKTGELSVRRSSDSIGLVCGSLSQNVVKVATGLIRFKCWILSKPVQVVSDVGARYRNWWIEIMTNIAPLQYHRH